MKITPLSYSLETEDARAHVMDCLKAMIDGLSFGVQKLGTDHLMPPYNNATRPASREKCHHLPL